MKHIGIRYHVVRDAVDQKHVIAPYQRSEENRADSFTKILGGDVFIQHREFMGCFSPDDISRPRGGMLE